MDDSDVPALISSSDSEDEDDEIVKLASAMRCFHHRENFIEHMQLIKVQALEPWLLGKASHPEIWLNYAYDIRLLPSRDVEEIFKQNVGLDDGTLHVVEVMTQVCKMIGTGVFTPVEVTDELRKLFIEIDMTVFCDDTELPLPSLAPPTRNWNQTLQKSMDQILDRAKPFSFLYSIKDKLAATQARHRKLYEKHMMSDRQLVICLLLVLRRYLIYVREEMKTKGAALARFQRKCANMDRVTSQRKQAGNDCFKAGDFRGAISAYTEAIERSRYNPILYGNRAQAYSSLKLYREALTDSTRSILLDPEWHKGYYRCTQALIDLKRYDMALYVTRSGRSACLEDRHLKEQESRIKSILKSEQEKPTAVSQQTNTISQRTAAELRKFFDGYKITLPSSSEVSSVITDADGRSEWRKGVPQELREKFALRLLEVMLSKPEDYKLQDKHVQEIKTIAKDAEAEIYKEALSKNEYYNMIADKIVAIDKELEVHKRRNFASPKKPGQETEVKGKDKPTTGTAASKLDAPATSSTLTNGTTSDNDDEPPGLVSSGNEDSEFSDDNDDSNKEVYENFLKRQKKAEEARNEKEKRERLKKQEKLEKMEKRQQREEIERKRRQEEESKQKKIDAQRREAELRRRDEERRKEGEQQKRRDKQAAEQAEQARKNKILRAKAEQEDANTSVFATLRDGSLALLELRHNNAVMFYTKALDAFTKHGLAYLNQFKEIDYVVLKYSLGDACVKLGTTKEILQGITWFNEILEKHNNVRFPLVFLGLGRAYFMQNRFKEAAVPLNRGLVVLKKKQQAVSSHIGGASVLTWPGTQTVIEETKAGRLQVALQELLNTCRYPPQPDAVCKFHNCSGHYSVHIYVNDPDLKGFVRVRCYAKCRIEYHLECWRKLKKQHIPQSDKDYLEYLCFTPNCKAKISDIDIYDQNAVLSKELKAPQQVVKAPVSNIKPVRVKMKTSSEIKLKAKAERKAKRKEYRQNQKEALELARNPPQNESLRIIESVENEQNEQQPHFNQNPVMILKKDQIDDNTMDGNRGKSKKSKRKEKVTSSARVTMHLDEFVGRDEEVYEDEFGVLHRQPVGSTDPSFLTSSVNVSSTNQSTPPAFGAGKLTTLSSYHGIEANIYQFFIGILQEHGPLMQDDVIVQRELDDFPPEVHDLIAAAGGLGKFLIQSLEFAMYDGVICLRKDAVRAKDIAHAYKTPFSDRYASVSTDSAAASTSGGDKKTRTLAATSLADQILDSSKGGFPNDSLTTKHSMSPEFNDPADHEMSASSHNGPETTATLSENSIFAGLNFKHPNKRSGSRLDQLDFIEDVPVTNTIPATGKQQQTLNVDQSSPAAALNSNGRHFELTRHHKDTHSAAEIDVKVRGDRAIIEQRQIGAKVSLMDDIDDDEEDFVSVASGSVTSSNGLYNVGNLFHRAVNNSRLATPVSDNGAAQDGMSSYSVASDRVGTAAIFGKPGVGDLMAPKRNNSANDIARLEDLETSSRCSADNIPIDDGSCLSSTSLSRNERHIQTLKQFSEQMSSPSDVTANTAAVAVKNLLPESGDFNSTSTSPASSVYSFSKSSRLDDVIAARKTPDIDNKSNSASEINESPLKNSRLRDWLPKTVGDNPDIVGDNAKNHGTTFAASSESANVADDSSLGGGILSNPDVWKGKKVDLAMLENFGSAMGSDDDDDDDDDELILQTVAYEKQNMAAAATSENSPLDSPTRYITPPSKLPPGLNLPGHSSFAKQPPVLPVPAVSEIDEGPAFPRAGVFGAIGSRTQSPSRSVLSSRASSKCSTPLHSAPTTASTAGAAQADALPVFPSAHDPQTNDLSNISARTNDTPISSSSAYTISSGFDIAMSGISGATGSSDLFVPPPQLQSTAAVSGTLFDPPQAADAVTSTLFDPTPFVAEAHGNPTSSLFPLNTAVKSSLWDRPSRGGRGHAGGDAHSDVSGSPEPLDGLDIDEEVQQVRKRMDEEFVLEETRRVFNDPRMRSTYLNNPNLLSDIEATVRADVARSNVAMNAAASAPMTSRDHNNARAPGANVITPTTTPRKSRSTRNCAVQYDVMHCTESTGVNTEPYEPYLDELRHTQADLQQVTSRFTDVSDKFERLKNSSSVELKELRELLDVSQLECKTLRVDCTKATDELTSESRRWQQQQRHLTEDVKTLKQQYRTAKAVESNLTSQLQDQREKLQSLTLELHNERETLTSEREHHESELNRTKKLAAIQLARAQNAEVRFLRLQMELGNKILDTALKESEMRCMQMAMMQQGFIERNQTAPSNVTQAEEHWRQNVTTLKDMRDKHVTAYEQQIELIQSGTQLDTLPELGLPKPPPPPVMPIHPGRMPGMMPFMNTGPPPFSMQNNASMPRPALNGGHQQQQQQPSAATPLQSSSSHHQLATAGRNTNNSAASSSVSSTTPPGLPTRAPGDRAPMTSSSMPALPSSSSSSGVGGRGKAKSSYERIITELQQMFPDRQKSDFMAHIQELRQSRGGKLSGLTMAGIIQHVAERLVKVKTPLLVGNRGPLLGTGAVGKPLSMSGTSSSSGAAAEEVFQEEEDPCLICMDELAAQRTSRLSCTHRFHTDCIKKWFQEQSTCPMCRNHTLLPDDYPSLR